MRGALIVLALLGMVSMARAGGVYWTDRGASLIKRMSFDGTGLQTITLSHPAVQTLYSNLDTPHGLALDIPARKLYWADTGNNAGTGVGDKAVSRGDFDGSTPIEVLATGSEPWDVDLDLRCRSYAEWRARYFRRDASPAQTNPTADPDGDGLPNAVEYALGLPPLRAAIPGLPQGLLIAEPLTNVLYHAIKSRRRAGTTDLSCYVQVSTNLTDWVGSLTAAQTTEFQVTPLDDGMEEVTVRTLYSVAGYPRHFLRWCVQLAP